MNDPLATRLEHQLRRGLEQMSLDLDAEQIRQLCDYVLLVQKWNRVYNLTAIRDPMRMISRHILDSLVLLRYLQGDTLLDVGSGAGLPGIPLAIAMPGLSCTLLDCVGKKTRFIQHVAMQLDLDNITVVQARVEEATLAPVDIVVARAFSSPVGIIEQAGRWCLPGGTLLFMLGRVDTALEQCLAAASQPATGSPSATLVDGYRLGRIDDVKVPFESAERHVAVCYRC